MGQTVWIARHGIRLDFVNPAWLKTAERFYDSPLSVDGFKQAQALGRYLKGKGVVHIFCSPFLRTVQTAHCIAEILDLKIKFESGLSEFLFPLWLPPGAEEFSIEKLAVLFPRIDQKYTSFVRAKYPEISLQQIQKRAGNTADNLVKHFSETILIVGHSSSVVGAVQGLINQAPSIDASKLCCLFKVVQTDLEWNKRESRLHPKSTS